MAEQKVGITVVVKDKASKAVAGIAKRAGLINSAFKKVQSVFKAFGFAIIALNQGVELLSKGFRFVSSAISSSVQAAIDLRGESDPLVRSFGRMRSSLKSIQATMGSAFLAAFTAVGKAFEPAVIAAKGFLENNRKLIATRIVQFLFKTAQAITEGVAFGLNQANTIWHTLTSTIDLSIMSISKFVGAWSMAMLSIEFTEKGQKILNERIETMSDIYNAAEKRVKGAAAAHQDYSDRIEAQKIALQALINKGYLPAMKAAAATADAMGETKTETAEERLRAFKERLGRLGPQIQEAYRKALEGKSRKEGMLIAETLERDLDLISRQAQTLSSETLPKVAKDVEDAFAKVGVDFKFPVDTNNVPLMKELIDQAVSMHEAFLLFEKEDFNLQHDKVELTAEKLKALHEAQLAHQKALNLETQVYEHLLANIPNLIVTIGNKMGSVVADVIKGQKKSGQAFVEIMQQALFLTIEVIKQSLMAYAVKTMGLLIAGEVASKGIFGLVTGAILASIALSAFQGLISKLPAGQVKGYAQGGLVTGGVAGRDSVPAMLTPGEFVVPKRDVDAARSGGGSSVNMTINTAVPPSRAEMKRYIRQNLIPAMRDLRVQGVVV